MPLEKRKRVAGLSPQRADIIVAGLLIIERVMRCLGVNVVQIHTRGVRDGMLLDMIQSSRAQRVDALQRRQAVEQFAEACGVDLQHACQVSRIATRLFDQLAAPLGFSAADTEILELAAILANVGYLINFDKHHKHSYHLIINSDLPGFERHELQAVALVARYHRGSHPKNKHEGYRDLTADDRQRVGRLAAILRLALALDRTHQQQVEDLHCSVTPSQVVIEVAAKENADVDIWAARRKVDLFERVFRRQVIIASQQR
jgi:exopolyphosphatase/guanosine-5'-triphosphate,3'-diphosphate pyrophosphatase